MKKSILLLLCCILSWNMAHAQLWGPNWTAKYYHSSDETTQPENDASGNSWFDANYDDSAWQTTTGPLQSTDNGGIFESSNCYWLRSVWNVTDNSVPNNKFYFMYVSCENDATIYFNGTELSVNSYDYGNINGAIIPSSLIKAGDNIIAVKVYDNGNYRNLNAYIELKSNYIAYQIGTTTCGISSVFSTDANLEVPATVDVDGVAMTVTEIGNSAFANNTTIQTVVLPASVTKINSCAFNRCSNLTSITGSGCTVIENDAFAECTSLMTVDMPNLKQIGQSAFYNCPFTSIEVAEDCQIYDDDYWPSFGSSMNGNTYTDGDFSFERSCAFTGHSYVIGAKITQYNADETNVVIPNTVTYDGVTLDVVKVSTDFNSKSMESISIPETVYDFYGLYNCSQVKQVTLPTNLRHFNYFRECTSLTDINIPDNVTNIEGEAFYNCHSLKNVTISDNSKLTSIGGYAFYNTGITSINIPESVTSIGYSAFQGCSGLTEIKLPETLTALPDGILSECSQLTKILGASKITEIGNSAFTNCQALETYAIPSTVTHIGQQAFYNCKSLTSIVIPSGVTKIENYTFQGCNGLKDITFKGNITSIGEWAFYGCNSLVMDIPSTVKSIGQYAFNDCNALTTINIPSGVTKIENGTFDGCI